MTLTRLPILTDAQMAAFEDECFCRWLNIVDARIGYDARRLIGDVGFWRAAYDAGASPYEQTPRN